MRWFRLSKRRGRGKEMGRGRAENEGKRGEEVEEGERMKERMWGKMNAEGSDGEMKD